MIEWLPSVCRELHEEMIIIYWMLILPLVLTLLVIELLKTSDTPNAGKIIIRAVISIILLISFKEVINVIAFVGDGIASRIDGLAKMTEIVESFREGLSRDAPSLYKVRELFIFLVNLLSYFLAYFGIFVAEALVHFCWSILYVCAPLMILCYIPQGLASICKNLYKGLLTVISWKILWSILGVLLLKLATQETTVHSDNIVTTTIINFCIALSILFVPFFAKSLFGDGLSGVATGVAATTGGIALKSGKMALTGGIKKASAPARERFQKKMRDLKENVSNPEKWNMEFNRERIANRRIDRHRYLKNTPLKEKPSDILEARRISRIRRKKDDEK